YQQGPAEILPQLYLGSSHNACPRILDTYGITCVINVAAEISTPNFGAFPYNNARTPGNRISYHHLPWTHSQDNLAEYEFTRAIRTIEEAQLANTTVLIHCQQGIERSAALVIAYKPLPLDNLQLSISQAYEFVRKRAPCIHPNMELMYQLKEFERKI
ncbi:protein-tyrosine phosphatase-like protein, partial [Radiomyces spectabilis]|uniref:protein-tyrosine phosphatase-like protein n=1 Tax=Radiomyces spectabilis TaxID=64574 RepID=UPI00221EA784